MGDSHIMCVCGILKNALNLSLKIITTRYDFKGSKTTLELKEKENLVILISEDDMKVRAALDILRTQMGKRGLSMRCLDAGEPVPVGNRMLKQVLTLKTGIDKENGKLINRLVKDSGIKVTSAYLDEKIRITGKSIDDLQAIYGYLKSHKEVEIDLQMENMKR